MCVYLYVLCLFHFAPHQSGYESKNVTNLKAEDESEKQLHLILTLVFLCPQDTDHPCTANNPESCTMSLSPQDFINLFNFWFHPNPHELTVNTCTYIVFVKQHNSQILDVYFIEERLEGAQRDNYAMGFLLEENTGCWQVSLFESEWMWHREKKRCVGAMEEKRAGQ